MRFLICSITIIPIMVMPRVMMKDIRECIVFSLIASLVVCNKIATTTITICLIGLCIAMESKLWRPNHNSLSVTLFHILPPFMPSIRMHKISIAEVPTHAVR